MEIVFNNQVHLWFLISLPVVVLLHYIMNRYAVKRALTFANFAALERVAKKPVISKQILFLTMRLLTLTAIILALAGITIFYVGESSEFDFVIAIDTSSSMLAKDFTPTRLDATKEGTTRFLKGLSTNSEVGLVSFAGTSYIEAFLTNDRKKLLDAIENMDVKPTGGTDLGEAIITSTNMLLSTEKSKAVLLVSDGESNVGVPIEEAIQYANQHNVAVHTIGIGTEEGGLFEEANVILRLDEETLKTIANQTGGTYSRATDNERLFQAHERIASSTTSKRLSFNLSFVLIVVALLLLFIDWSLISTKYKVSP